MNYMIKKNPTFLNTSDWSRLLSPSQFRTFPAMCGSSFDTQALVHIEQPLCAVWMVPGQLPLKPCSCFFLGTFKSSQTLLPMWAQMMFVWSAIIRCSIICMFYNALRKCEQSIFSAVSKWECRLLAAGYFFSKITDCLHVVPTTTTNWTSRICQKHSCSPPTQSGGLNLDTYHSPPLCKSHIPELL